MHLLKHNKVAKPAPLVPIISQWKVPYHRKMRGRRYNSKGEEIGTCGPLKRPDPEERRRLLRAKREAALLPPPQECEGFDLKRFTPLPGRILLKRPPQITEEKGVRLPENKWYSQPFFFVVKTAPDVTVCQAGDRVVFAKKHNPKPVRLGQPFHIGRATAVVATLDA